MYRKPVCLGPEHDLRDFDCGKPVMDAFLKDMARHNQEQGFTRTFVIADKDFTVVGYHSLCAGMIARHHVPRSIKAHQAPVEIPVALIVRLAVDRRHQGQGLGAALLRNALQSVVTAAESVAFRAVAVHALDDGAAEFYIRYGFRQAKGMERTLLLPLKDISASAQA
jgi:GNAT superfamily N-acetyltransferase